MEDIRRFNRLYTARIGALQGSHLGSGWSLAEARILYELSRRPAMTATEICELLRLDQGYVSRILARFGKKGLITRRVSAADGRVQRIALTQASATVYADLDAKAHAAVAALIQDKPEHEQRALAAAAQTFERMLGEAPAAPVVIRGPKPGDLGWIVHRHGVLLTKEFGWDQRFEAKVAEIVGTYGESPGRERCWIAERGGDIAGAVFIVPEDSKTARLRLLYVEPWARGLGIGRKLVELAVAFARDAGYRKLVLWTHEFQAGARRIYVAAGFRLASREATQSFGVDVVSETWEMDLSPSTSSG